MYLSLSDHVLVGIIPPSPFQLHKNQKFIDSFRRYLEQNHGYEQKYVRCFV